MHPPPVDCGGGLKTMSQPGLDMHGLDLPGGAQQLPCSRAGCGSWWMEGTAAAPSSRALHTQNAPTPLRHGRGPAVSAIKCMQPSAVCHTWRTCMATLCNLVGGGDKAGTQEATEVQTT
jgi:hypothetical protein